MGWANLSGRMYSGSATISVTEFTAKYTYTFDGIQDLTRMEAVIYGGMAYPLDGGAPYAYDTSGLPFPFRLSGIEDESGEFFVPLSQLCQELGISENWDAESGTASITYRGRTCSCTAEDEQARLWNGELWVSSNTWVYANLRFGTRPVWERDSAEGSSKLVGMVFLP